MSSASTPVSLTPSGDAMTASCIFIRNRARGRGPASVGPVYLAILCWRCSSTAPSSACDVFMFVCEKGFGVCGVVRVCECGKTYIYAWKHQHVCTNHQRVWSVCVYNHDRHTCTFRILSHISTPIHTNKSTPIHLHEGISQHTQHHQPLLPLWWGEAIPPLNHLC